MREGRVEKSNLNVALLGRVEIEKCALCHIHYDVVRRSSSECRKKSFSRNINETKDKVCDDLHEIKVKLFYLRNKTLLVNNAKWGVVKSNF